MLRIKQDYASTNQYVPLKQVSIKANIHSFAANVTIKQIFRNDETPPIEAVYCFPIEEQAAIYSFIARMEDRQIIAQLKEKKQAQQEYNDALQQGHGAYLLEQDEKSQDTFIINIGPLPPRKECHIEISYVTELDLVENGTKIRFVVPTTIAPRYNPNKGSIASPAGTTATYVQSAPYTVEFHFQIDKVNIAGVSSSSHPIQVNLDKQDVYVIEFGQKNTHLDRDILLDIRLAKNRPNTIIAVEHDAVMASFTPNQEDCQLAMDNTEVTNEFIFIVDCSGSMKDENKIEYARQAMLLFLKSLPVNCFFNIIRFGSIYETLFKDITAIYNNENAQRAEHLTNNMEADLCGTELLRLLQWLDEHPSKQGRARQIFLLTDGEISNVDEVLDLCRSMSSSSRIFSFGPGRSPSRSLVKGLARATNGRYVFIPPGTSVDVYIGEQLEKALQSCITNVQVKWNLARNVMNVPTKTPPVYVNDRLIVYALATDDDLSCIVDHNSNVELYNDKGRLGDAKVNQIPNVSDDGTIARLAAKALILELQHSKLPSSNKKSGSLQLRFVQRVQEATEESLKDEKEKRKKRMIDLSFKYNILSPHTAFIGIEKRVNGDNVDMVLREVPIQISADDQHLRSSFLQCHPSYPMQSMSISTQSPMALSNASSLIYKSHSISTPSPTAHGYASSLIRRRLPSLPRRAVSCEDSCEEQKSNSLYLMASCNLENMLRHRVKKTASASIRSASCIDAPRRSLMPESLRRMIRFITPCRATESRSQTHTSSDADYRRYSNNVTTTKDEMRDQQKKEEAFSTDDQDIVRHLISQQSFDGLWDLDSKSIEQLTGKSLSHFQQATNNQVLVSAIVVSILETRFASFSSMWHGVVQKSRKRLLYLSGNDTKKLENLFEDIRKQL